MKTKKKVLHTLLAVLDRLTAIENNIYELPLILAPKDPSTVEGCPKCLHACGIQEDYIDYMFVCEHPGCSCEHSYHKAYKDALPD